MSRHIPHFIQSLQSELELGRKLCSKIWEQVTNEPRKYLVRTWLYPSRFAFVRGELAGFLRDQKNDLAFTPAEHDEWEHAIWMARGSDSLLERLMGWKGRQDDLTGRGKKMSKKVLFLLAAGAAATAGVAYFLYYRRRGVSEAYSKFAEKYGDCRWGHELLETGDPESWRISDAWEQVEFTESERAGAITKLSKDSDFKLIHPKPYTSYNSDEMRSDSSAESDGFVVECLQPGLRGQHGCLEPAHVRIGSADYVALQRLGDRDITRNFLDQYKNGISEDFRFRAGDLKSIETKTTSDETLDNWLYELCEMHPNDELEPMIEGPGGEFVSRTMSTRRPLSAENASVTEVLHSGLKRVSGSGDEEVLLRASVRVEEEQKDDPFAAT